MSFWRIVCSDWLHGGDFTLWGVSWEQRVYGRDYDRAGKWCAPK